MRHTTRHITLASGLQLSLRHAPHLKRAAAALRVHAGSHDAPAKWPGLAHFLEHLFFLGTARFPLEDGLMRYVQAVGGQVNASTRERTTDFFFEVPPTSLAGGLERLCQMLTSPDLGIDRQRREREVIHAEFIAWSRNPQAQLQFARLQSAAPGHPLSGFHAGNRYSLPLQDAAFQEALAGFHQRYYQGGQITLSLCGPQCLDELEQLGKAYAEQFVAGERVTQLPPPPLASTASGLVFTHNALPAGAEQALELLIAYLSDSRPGSWLNAVQQRGWVRDFTPESLYAFAGQMLWHVGLQLTSDDFLDEAQALLNGWFGFIRQCDPAQLNAGFGVLQLSREHCASALELARRDGTNQPFAALDAQGLHALKVLLDSLPYREHGQWQLPPAEPLLSTDLPSQRDRRQPAALAVSQQLPAARQHAALYLRWQVKSPVRKALFEVLEHTLQPLQQRCQRASLQLQFSAMGDHWQLRCSGMPAGVIRAVDEALTCLQSPINWQPTGHSKPALIPIRALLQQLPAAMCGTKQKHLPASRPDRAMLEEAWLSSQWHGLASGFDNTSMEALNAVLQGCPGRAGIPMPVPTWHGRHWLHQEVPGSEHALLLFCPLPPARQAAGRLLAQLLQGPVYQRLRVELQLGYAVFSTFRQIEGLGGLLFGVQSPHATQAEILQHLRDVLARGASLTPATRTTLAAQYDEPAMGNDDIAEWAWQTHLATQPDDLQALRKSILGTEQSDIDQLLLDLLHGNSTWICLANSGAPDLSWH
ncbi:pyrroloquinoline quinone biosynthesis protein PqqF [Pseudomonas sp. PSKL.D1]|uniref:pyrroloquinoline quinone biosynthesis protein PqqF n=1 Tax=Pseudomonas sp. PSKL.D1 TaxID=3029060 RepID=UPI0023815513|nr:pyrroloquinoline quinone biosynthesis protein PqqF [Pseudomonas sp. PSKL.D1]WDY57653.1 pyrroloquinoline quinone biosynthesis protein PqqF [Pseudomonas sp. PSKL.D1]